MRLLFVSSSGLGHVHPLVPLASELRSAGNEILFAGKFDALSSAVTLFGFVVADAGAPVTDAEMADVFATMPKDGDPWGGAFHFLAHSFIRLRSGKMLGDLISVAEYWQPDLIVHELGVLASRRRRAARPATCVRRGRCRRIVRDGYETGGRPRG